MQRMVSFWNKNQSLKKAPYSFELFFGEGSYSGCVQTCPPMAQVHSPTQDASTILCTVLLDYCAHSHTQDASLLPNEHSPQQDTSPLFYTRQKNTLQHRV